MSNDNSTFGAIPFHLYIRATQRRGPGIFWRPFAALAAIVFVSAGSYELGVWDGRNSQHLSLEQARAVIHNDRMDDAEVVTASFRLHKIAKSAIAGILEARTRNISVRNNVDVWLDQLATQASEENRNKHAAR